MAITAPAAFTPSGYTQYSPTSTPSAVALPNGSTPDKVLLTNLSGEPAICLLTTAAATTTATGSQGSNTITVASATSIAVGQAAVAAGVPQGAVVTGISGTTVTLSMNLAAPLSSTAINFVNTVQLNTGIAIMPQQPQFLAIGSNTFLSAVSSGTRTVLNVAVGV